MHLYAQMVKDTNLGKRFNKVCTPFIKVDGYHLKGPHGRAFLSAIVIDGNCGLFPVVVDVVELENGDPWSWFLNLVNTTIGDINKPLAMMSDAQKGLDDIIIEIMPHVIQRRVMPAFNSKFSVFQSGKTYAIRLKQNTLLRSSSIAVGFPLGAANGFSLRAVASKTSRRLASVQRKPVVATTLGIDRGACSGVKYVPARGGLKRAPFPELATSTPYYPCCLYCPYCLYLSNEF
ncbi:Uncharacterized protein TCM_043566 [Theobroma cacao]|uniref:MULE transposase domain-containing protein n=1 Tax=Theobroma cacao TaxID=3641 RepID=A0A061FQ02_THECC|nr:Uncharacterized protein TCM_043566 [Theobroma cacao]